MPGLGAGIDHVVEPLRAPLRQHPHRPLRGILDRPGAWSHLREAAQNTAVEHYAASKLVPLRARLLEAVGGGLMDG